MKKETVTTKTVYTCDRCGKTSENNSGWLSFELQTGIGFRLLEFTKNPSTKHLRERVQLDFCCQDCIRGRLMEEVDLFIREYNPPKNRGTSSTVIV